MRIGIPTEIKPSEYRVGMVPYSVAELVLNGHDVFVQQGAGDGIGLRDEDYVAAGAQILDSLEAVYDHAEMIVKVKEPQARECALLKEGQVLFTFLHLAPDPEQAEGLIKSGCTAIAYETVTDDHCGLPLLSPMSEVAGRLSIQTGAHALEKVHGGRGILLGGVPGVERGQVVVIGGGVVGRNAIRMAMGKGARCTVIDRSLTCLRKLDREFGTRLNTVYSTHRSIEEHVAQADLIIGAVLLPGGAAPKLVSREMLSKMRKRAVIVDVAIDQGGCFETSKPTTHEEPTYIVDDVVHYCVANMPGAVPRTSAFALNNATLPFVIALANKGYRQAMLDDPHLLNGLNVHQGSINCHAVAKALNKNYVPAREAIT